MALIDVFPWWRRKREWYRKATTHPANSDVLTFLKSQADPLFPASIVPWGEIAYGQTTHPDLEGLLRELVEKLPDHYSELLYGVPVVTNSHGVLCVLAYSMSILAFRLPEHMHAEALALGGKPIAGLGHNWVELNPWRPGVSEQEGVEILRPWCERAYEYAGELSARLSNNRE